VPQYVRDLKDKALARPKAGDRHSCDDRQAALGPTLGKRRVLNRSSGAWKAAAPQARDEPLERTSRFGIPIEGSHAEEAFRIDRVPDATARYGMCPAQPYAAIALPYA